MTTVRFTCQRRFTRVAFPGPRPLLARLFVGYSLMTALAALTAGSWSSWSSWSPDTRRNRPAC